MTISLRRVVAVSCMALALIAVFVGCENSSDSEDSGGVVFKNESTHDVSVYWSLWNLRRPEVPSFVLKPGESETAGEDLDIPDYDTIYYDWEPKDSVNANQVDKDEVVFVDK